MSWPYGNDWEYAQSRLKETIVRHNDKPYYVSGIDMLGKTVGYYLDDDKVTIVDAKELDTSPLKLGYANFNGKVYYLSRVPKRRDWRQGLRKENMASFPHAGLRVLSLREIGRVIAGIYPTFQKCVELSNKGKELAWHRQWALVRGSVHYRGDVVGVVEDGAVVLGKDYQYLKEALEEAL